MKRIHLHIATSLVWLSVAVGAFYYHRRLFAGLALAAATFELFAYWRRAR